MFRFFLPLFIFALYAGFAIAQSETVSKDKFLGGYHMTKQGMTCEDCHQEKAPVAGKLKKQPVKDLDICASCHGRLEEVAKLKPELEPNPHTTHEGEIPCDECHHSHSQSVSYCDQCHAFGFVAP